jgi:hypothetical protein
MKFRIMNRILNSRALLAFVYAAVIMSAASCVNEDYASITEDGIDKTVNVLKNVSLPVGSLEKVLLSDVLDIADDMSLLEIDQDGNLAIRIADDENVLSQSVTVPHFSFENSYRGFITEQYLGEFHFMYNDMLSDLLDILKVPRKFPDIPLVIEFQKDDLPYEIKDLRYAEVQALATLSLTVRIDQEIPFTAYVAAGTQLVFPEWVVLGTDVEGMSVEGNIVTLNEDIPVYVTTPENEKPSTTISIPVVAVDATKLPEGQGIMADRSFLMKDYMHIIGSAYFTFDGIENVSATVVSPVISTLMTFSNLGIHSAEIMLGDEVEDEIVTGLSPISLEGMPDFIKNKDLILDVNDIRLDVDFSNLSPFAGEISAVVATSLAGEPLADVTVGPVRFEAGSDKAPAQMYWSFSEGHLNAPEGYTLYKVEGLTDIVKKMPDMVEFKDFELDLDDEYVTVRPGETYELAQSYSIYAPLAFGPDFHVPYTYEIQDLDFVFDGIGLSSAVLDVDVENSIPMNFSASAHFIGENGEILDDVVFNIKDGAVLKAGSLDSPSMTHMTFVLENQRDELKLYGLVLKFEATAPDSQYLGVPLNINQGLHFKNIVLNLPEGITADLDEI